ncbi:MAG: hypothetical protein SGPRY_000491 [Prymnesium sp.]
MLVGDLRSISLSPEETPFFFPTGLSRLTYEYCGKQVCGVPSHDRRACKNAAELGEPLAQLKSAFSRVFESGGAPFRALPLSAEATTYAASDAWHVWLVHEALRPRLEAAALTPLVLRASECFARRVSEQSVRAERAAESGQPEKETWLGCCRQALLDTRASEFRDVFNGRELWDAKMKQARRRNVSKRQRDEGGKMREGGQGKEGGEGGERDGERPAKRRVVRGPMCAEGRVRFSGEKQLEEHRGGKHHAMVASVVGKPQPTSLMLRASVTLEESKLLSALSVFGEVRRLQLLPKSSKHAGFGAILEYSSSAEVGRALGPKELYVDGIKVSVVPASGRDMEARERKREKKSQLQVAETTERAERAKR